MIVLTVATFSMSTLAYEQRAAELRRRASHDALTGVLTRGAFHDHAPRVLRRAHAAGERVAVVLADLDRFKVLNDTYGHARGDTCLQSYAQACREAVRPTDLLARYGGEEFLLLLPGVAPYRVREIIERIDARYLESQEPLGMPPQTASYGVADAEDGVPLERTIAAADAALYRAKDGGRARAVFVPDGFDGVGGRAGGAAAS